ncbi:MAG TPA: GNAT family protein [Longilinea sp.]|nr:GNAT family protein [Longilinea sp.]
MKFTTQLFKSEHLILNGYDPEKDAAREAEFTCNLDYAWAMDVDIIPHPLSSYEVKKLREEALKKSDEKKDCYLYSIQVKEDDHFIGTVVFPWISWKNQDGFFQVSIGEQAEDNLYFEEALHMALRYAFEELGLKHTVTRLGGHDEFHLERMQKAGMTLEVRQRQMHFRGGKLWDRWLVGMSRDEWLRHQIGE